jgi:hypothetical protein
MQTLTQPQPTTANLTVDSLRAIVVDVRRRYPQAGMRLDHATFIVLCREVERGTSAGIWWIQSESDPNQTYMAMVGRQSKYCCCQDFARRGALTPCKHLLAVEIFERAERRAAELGDPTTEPIPYEITAAGYALFASPAGPACPACGGEGLPDHPGQLCRVCISDELFGGAA